MAAPGHVSRSHLSTAATDDADSTGGPATGPSPHHSRQHHCTPELPRMLRSMGGELVLPVSGR